MSEKLSREERGGEQIMGGVVVDCSSEVMGVLLVTVGAVHGL